MEREDEFFRRLGQAVRVERTRQGRHQDELAEAAGLSKAYVSHIENGRRHPSMDAVTGLARALGLTIGQLLAAAEPGVGGALVAGVGGIAADVTSSVRRGVVSRSVAEGAVADAAVARSLGERALERVQSSASRDPSLVTDVQLLAALLTAFADGTYRGCLREDVVLIAGALAYLATPLDQFPDWLGEEGLHDDLGVLAYTLGMTEASLADFRAWVRRQSAG